MATKKNAAPMERHTTISGEVLEYPRPGPELAAFLGRVRTAAEDPRVSEGELVELIYGLENPLLDKTIFKGRGAVTTEVFANPVYHVMLDLLDAKRVQTGTLDPERAAGRYTMTVTEAAEFLGVTSSAVRQAIAAKHLDAWKKGGLHFLDPQTVETYRSRVKRRGPRAAGARGEGGGEGGRAGGADDGDGGEGGQGEGEGELEAAGEPALRIRFGNRPGASFRVKAPGLDVLEVTKVEGGGKLMDAIVPAFERAAIAFGGARVHRMFVLEPADEPNRFQFEGFEVRGRYRVAEKVNDPEESSKRYKAFKAS